MRAGERLRIEGLIRSIPLVERQYRIGLWINSGAFVGEVQELADLTVSPAMVTGQYARAAPEHRGWVEFKTECSARLYPDSSLVPATE